MSRIGKLAISLPSGVDLKINQNLVTVKGPKGELTYQADPGMILEQEEGTLLVKRPSDERKYRALHGLTRTLINNMVVGVSQGYTRVLLIEGVGYRAEQRGAGLQLALGYS
ncbi:MAG TPA: 50S ribosomal protein L6, partial [Calditrichia bacterium]|nr:50S ribosomal protein L6 [Calditrichia bacterium]